MVPLSLLSRQNSAVAGVRKCSSLREKEIFRGLLPFVSIDDRLADKANLENELSQRNISANIEEISQLWHEYKTVDAEIKALENRRSKVTAEVKKGNEEARAEGKKLREQGKELSKMFAAAERLAISAALALPVPLASNFNFKCPVIKNDRIETPAADSSIEVGQRLKVLDWRDEWRYFLLGRAARYELAAPLWLFSKLKSTGVRLMSGVDLSRPALTDAVPGYGSPCLTTGETIFGIAAAATAAAPLARSVIPSKALPIHWLSIGRRYILPSNISEGLHKAVQRQCAHVLLVGSSKSEVEDVISSTWEAMSELGLNNLELRMTNPPDLLAWEAGRVEIVTESPLTKQPICLGALSHLGEQAAQRLRMYVKKSPEATPSFPLIYSGSLLDVPSLLTYVLEHGDIEASKLLDSHLAIFQQR